MNTTGLKNDYKERIAPALMKKFAINSFNQQISSRKKQNQNNYRADPVVLLSEYPSM